MQQEKCQKRIDEIMSELGVMPHERSDLIWSRYQTIKKAKVEKKKRKEYRTKVAKTQQQMTRLLQEKKHEIQITEDIVQDLHHKQESIYSGSDEDIYQRGVLLMEEEKQTTNLVNAKRWEKNIDAVGKSLLQTFEQPFKKRKYDRLFAKYVSYRINTSGKGLYTTMEAMKRRGIKTSEKDYRKAKKMIKRYLDIVDDRGDQMTLDL